MNPVDRLYLCVGGPIDGELRPLTGLKDTLLIDREFNVHEYRLRDWPQATGPALYYEGKTVAPGAYDDA